MFDFNEANKQTGGTLIPDNSIVPVSMTIRPGGAGEGGWLKRSKSGESLMLDCEFVIVEGEFAKRKFWANLVVDGTSDGQKTAADISRSRLRAALESAKGVNPSDETEDAVKARRVETFGDFDGLRFWAVVGISKGKDNYPDRNDLKAIVTPDRKEWRKLDQVKSAGGGSKPAASAAPAQSRPSWAA